MWVLALLIGTVLWRAVRDAGVDHASAENPLLLADPQPGEMQDLGALTSEGGTAAGDSVVVSAPAGAVGAGDTLTAASGRGTTATAAGVFGQPVEGRHTAPLAGPVTIRWSNVGLDEQQRSTVVAAKWDADLEVWRLEPNVEVVVEGDDLVLQVPGFSIWTWVAGVGQKVGEVTGTRVQAPECGGGALPGWVRQVVDPDEELAAAAIRVCFEPDGDKVAVRVANNRTFAQQMVVRGESPGWAETSPGEPSYGMQQAAIDAARLVFDGPTRYLLPPTHEVAVRVARPPADAPSVFESAAEVNGVTVIVDVVAWLLDQQSVGGLDNPYLNAMVQALFECGGKQVAAAGGRPDALLPAVVDALGGCATEIMRPDSEFGLRMEELAREAVERTASDKAAKAYRLIGQAAQAFKVLSAGKVAFYLSDQLANAAVGPLSWSIRGRQTPQELGAWTPTCSDPTADSNRLYRNVALQDQFDDTSLELHQFPGWAAAAAAGIEPLDRCTAAYRLRLADALPSSWEDQTAAQVVAQAIRGGSPGGGAAPRLDALVLSETGLGPLRMGSTVAEAEATGMVSWDPAMCPAEIDGSDIGGLKVHPDYWPLSGANPVGLEEFPAFAVDVDPETGRVGWIAVLDPAITTAEGIGVGDTFADLDAAYGDALRFGDSNDPGQESYVRWMRRGNVDIEFDLWSGAEGRADAAPARIWSISVRNALQQHESTWRTDDGPGAC